MRLNWIGPANSMGYGIASWNIYKELVKLGHEVSFLPIGTPDLTSPEDKTYYSYGIDLKPDPAAPTVKLWHQFDMSIPLGSRKVGFTFFELDRLTERDIASIRTCDHMIVASKWAKEIVERDTWVKTSVVPMGVDSKIFYPSSEQTSGPVKFLIEGKFEKRKNHHLLPEIINRAFKPTDNVEFWMLVDNPFNTPPETQKCKQLYLNTPLGRVGKIKFFPRQISQTTVADLMRAADYGIFISSGEGFNLGLLEMMACGKKCVATNYSAHTEFCSNENCDLIDIDELEDAYDQKWFFGQGKWAKFGEKQKQRAAECLQDFYAGCHVSSHLDFKINYGGLKTAAQLTWKNSAEKLIEMIQGI